MYQQKKCSQGIDVNELDIGEYLYDPHNTDTTIILHQDGCQLPNQEIQRMNRANIQPNAQKQTKPLQVCTKYHPLVKQ